MGNKLVRPKRIFLLVVFLIGVGVLLVNQSMLFLSYYSVGFVK